jgi:hypothetical protein
MKQITYFLAVSALCLASQASASICGTNKLCVPEDFQSPNGADFNMDLLGGTVYLDWAGQQSGTGIAEAPLNNLMPIGFHASPFSNPTNSSVGTSTLSYSSINHYSLGTFDVAGAQAEFYLQGTGSGNLTDIDGTQGNWSLNVPLYATWNDIQFNFGNIQLSSAGTLYYYSISGLSSLSGQSMDYASGNTFLVGQATVTDSNNPFYGVRVTLGLNGNDPVVSSVPEASIGWQLLAGLGVLGGFCRIRNRSLLRGNMPSTTV